MIPLRLNPITVSQHKGAGKLAGWVTDSAHAQLRQLAKDQYFYVAQVYLTGAAHSQQDKRQVIPAMTRAHLRRIAVTRKQSGRGLMNEGQLIFAKADWRPAIGGVLVRAGQGKEGLFVPVLLQQTRTLNPGSTLRIVMEDTPDE